MTSDQQEQPEFFEDFDRRNISHSIKRFERQAMFKPKKKDVIGTWFKDPIDEREDKFKWQTIEGDNMFADPPDSNLGPVVDHQMDEEVIWSFQKNLYNHEVIENEWITNPLIAARKNYAPYWAEKLNTPSKYTPEKEESMKFQWQLRKGLEEVKIKHANYGYADEETKKRFAQEL